MENIEMQSKQEFIAVLAAKLGEWSRNETLDTFADIVGDLLDSYIDWKGCEPYGAEPDVGIMSGGYEYAECSEDNNAAWVVEVFTDLPQAVQDRLSEKACERLELPVYDDID